MTHRSSRDMAARPTGSWHASIGRPLRRKEDERLIKGGGRFLADLTMPGMIEAAFLRSHEAHGLIRELEAPDSGEDGRIVAFFTAEDLPPSARVLDRPFYQLQPEFVTRHSVVVRPTTEAVLANDHVRRVGEPVGLLVAEDRAAAVDGIGAAFLDIEALEPVLDPLEATGEGAPLVDPEIPGNVQAGFAVSVGDPEGAVHRVPHSVGGRFRIGRSIGAPIENRGVIAAYDAADDSLTVWATTQIPHILRSYLAQMLGMREAQVRVIGPDMGGSFGGGIYPEEIAVAWAATVLGRPVRWLESRTEDLVNSRHSRDQVIDARLHFDAEGCFQALTVDVVQDCGLANPFGITLPFNLVSHIRSQYAIENFRATGTCVLTNKTRNTPVRGAGRPEAAFVMERLVDMAARMVNLDPSEVRRRNLRPAEAMPCDLGMLYRDGNPLVYDSGDFPDQLDAALSSSDYERLREMQREEREKGRLIGIGIACHVEGTGLGPSESAAVEVTRSGQILVRSGSQPHGQGHETTLAQVCADVLRVDPGDVTVSCGDTALVEHGWGTFGSRSAVTAGAAVGGAAEKVRRTLLELAAELLEIDTGDLWAEEHWVGPRGTPGVGFSYSQLVSSADVESIESVNTYSPPSVTFGSGTQVAVVEVDPETGSWRLLQLVIVHDSGTVLNPIVVIGQQHGGAAHGLGNALSEEVLYSDNGQPLTTTFLDYVLPAAPDVPSMTVVDRPHPTPLNPLGVKGTGEGATSSTPAAVANAIADALRPLDLRLFELPMRPERVFRAVREATERDRHSDGGGRSPEPAAGRSGGPAEEGRETKRLLGSFRLNEQGVDKKGSDARREHRPT